MGQFNVSYNFVAQNQFSGTAAKIAKSAKNVSKSIKPIKKDLVNIKKTSKIATQSIRTDLTRTATVGSNSFNKLDRTTTGFKTALKKIKAVRPFRKIQSGVSKLRRSMRSLRKDTTGAGRSLAGAFKGFIVGAGLFVAARKFITVGADFQDAVADLSAITGATGKDLALLSDETLRLAKSSATAQTEVAAAAKIVGSQREELLSNLPALISVTEQVLLLKNASGIELAQASEIVTKSLNIFGFQAQDTARVVNVLAAGAKFGASEIADTGAAVVLAGSKAEKAGLSFEELNSLIQAAAKGGFKGTIAGTALSAIIGRLTRAGIDFRKSGIAAGFQSVKDVIDKQTDSTKQALLIAKIFGEEHDKVGLAILKNIGLLDSMTRKITGTKIAQEQATIRLATFNAKMRKLGVIIKDRVIRVFNRLEPVLTKLAIRFGNFVDSITPEQLNQFGDDLKIFIADAAVIGEAIGKILKSAFTSESIKQFRTELSEILNTINLMVGPLKFFASIFKGVGTGIGEAIAQFSSGISGEKAIQASIGFKEAFSVGGDLFGVLDKTTPTINNVVDFPEIDIPKTDIKNIVTPNINNVVDITKADISLPAPAESPVVTSPEDARSTVDININAPDGVVKDIKTNRTGTSKKLNVGVNMKETG